LSSPARQGYEAGIAFDMMSPWRLLLLSCESACLVPHGALTNKVSAGQQLDTGVSVETAELLRLPSSRGSPAPFSN